jgi:hypothetical protein
MSALSWCSWPSILGSSGAGERSSARGGRLPRAPWLSREAWGRGYATEIGAALVRLALGDLRLARLVSLIDVGNVASKHVAGKLGMSLESLVERPAGIARELWVIEAKGL